MRTETVQGTVHDEKAYYSMGGISGHAGLFGNAEDLAKLASVMLTGGYGGNRYFSRNVMDTFMAPKKEDALKLIPEGAAGGHPSVRSAESLLSLYRSMGEGAGDSKCAEQADILEEKLDSIIGTGE